tara:strand:- start:840 stop:968 length:129 start_codon:yes stop_codon:yes gene_type:complete
MDTLPKLKKNIPTKKSSKKTLNKGLYLNINKPNIPTKKRDLK